MPQLDVIRTSITIISPKLLLSFLIVRARQDDTASRNEVLDITQS